MAELDLEALRRQPRHRWNCARVTWGDAVEFGARDPGPEPDCNCDWPAILGALERAERVEAAARRVVRRYYVSDNEQPELAALHAALAAALAEPCVICEDVRGCAPGRCRKVEEAVQIARLRAAGCKCSQPLLGYRPNTGPRCRLCNTVAAAPAEEGGR